MNLRKTVIGIVAGCVFAAATGAPLALAADDDTTNNTTAVTVTFLGGGLFDAYFCSPDIADEGAVSTNTDMTVATQPDAETAGLAEGTVGVCYVDTKNQRPSFDLSLGAGNFVGEDHAGTIPPSNLTIVFTSAVAQTQCSTIVCGLPSLAGVGDIGYYFNDGVDPGGQSAIGAPWTVNGSLDQSRDVHFGHAGIGTILSGGAVDLDLVLPIGTVADTYEATLTLSVILGAQP